MILSIAAILIFAACSSMSDEDKYLWNSSTNPPPAAVQTPAK
ncbi:MAG TPA: hypothetical protein VGR78_15485 [Verrucomicrobiae bacterium]|nr:hypothetical protein [Verrucomicrobiae bacterium]